MVDELRIPRLVRDGRWLVFRAVLFGGGTCPLSEGFQPGDIEAPGGTGRECDERLLAALPRWTVSADILLVVKSLPRVSPMILQRLPAPFDHPDWTFEEINFDGFRATAYIEDGKSRLVSRKDHVYKSFQPMCDSRARLPVKSAILDGESRLPGRTRALRRAEPSWVKIKNPKYSQTTGRSEKFKRNRFGRRPEGVHRSRRAGQAPREELHLVYFPGASCCLEDESFS